MRLHPGLFCALYGSALQVIQLFINAVLGQKLLMGALLPQLTVVHDHNLIRMLNSGEPMGHHNGCPPLHHLGHGLLNQALGFGVDVGRGFVHDQHIRVKSQGTCKAQ